MIAMRHYIIYVPAKIWAQPGAAFHGKLIPGTYRNSFTGEVLNEGRWCNVCKLLHGELYECPHYPSEVLAELMVINGRITARRDMTMKKMKKKPPKRLS